MPRAILALFLFAPFALAQERGEPFEPPFSGRPKQFSGAVGDYRISAEAKPKAVQVEKPLLFTIRITASGPVRVPPPRPDLAADSEFADRFHIEPADPPGRQGQNSWEFSYVLKPRSVDVKEIPEVSFCYFDPSFGSDARGYQTRRSEEIPLIVSPASTELPKIEGSASASPPEYLLQRERGERILRRDSTWQLPAAPLLILFLAAPPVGCAAWYVIWRRLRPDSDRLAHRRRSRAARRALKMLAGRHSLGADQVAAVVTQYFHERFGLATVTLTPAEAQSLLEQVAVPEQLQSTGQDLLAACDAARYSPTTFGRRLADDASTFIQAVEAATWSSSS